MNWKNLFQLVLVSIFIFTSSVSLAKPQRPSCFWYVNSLLRIHSGALNLDLLLQNLVKIFPESEVDEFRKALLIRQVDFNSNLPEVAVRSDGQILVQSKPTGLKFLERDSIQLQVHGRDWAYQKTRTLLKNFEDLLRKSEGKTQKISLYQLFVSTAEASESRVVSQLKKDISKVESEAYHTAKIAVMAIALIVALKGAIVLSGAFIAMTSLLSVFALVMAGAGYYQAREMKDRLKKLQKGSIECREGEAVFIVGPESYRFDSETIYSHPNLNQTILATPDLQKFLVSSFEKICGPGAKGQELKELNEKFFELVQTPKAAQPASGFQRSSSAK